MNNQPAFPTLRQDRVYQNFNTTDGMTLRDYFAAKALAECSFLTSPVDKAYWSYKMADAMLKTREA